MSDLEKTLQAMIEKEVARQLGAARPANDVAPELVTIAAYARARSISESTVRKAIREQRLRAKKIGRSVRIRPTDEIATPARGYGPAEALAIAEKRLRLVR